MVQTATFSYLWLFSYGSSTSGWQLPKNCTMKRSNSAPVMSRQ